MHWHTRKEDTEFCVINKRPFQSRCYDWQGKDGRWVALSSRIEPAQQVATISSLRSKVEIEEGSSSIEGRNNPL